MRDDAPTTSEKADRPSLVHAGALFFVTLASLAVLLFVGFTEASRTYARFQIERLRAEAQVLLTSMDPLIQAGVPLRQFGGFPQLAQRTIEADNSVSAIAVFDSREPPRPVFEEGEERPGLIETRLRGMSEDVGVDVRGDGRLIQVVLELRSRFERLGVLVVTMPTSAIEDPVMRHFKPLVWTAAGGSLFFALLAAWALKRAGPRLQWVAGPAGLAAVFVFMSLAVVVSMVDLYAEGAQAKTRALASSLAERLEPIVTFGLSVGDFGGMQRTFASYRDLNPDISAIALLVDGKATIHTDRNAVGQPWMVAPRAYQYVVPLGPEGAASRVQVAVSLPADVVWTRVFRAAKDFAALFIASILLARLFLQLSDTLTSGRPDPERAPERAIDLVRPAFMVAVLAENLIVSFLPQHLQMVAANASSPSTMASFLFMAYFVTFAFSLPPAAAMAERRGPKPVIAIGALLAALGFLPLLFTRDPLATALGRALSGLGQGMLLAGTQSLVLAYAHPSRRTQGTAIIVYGFNAGMIAGAALGSLLANLLGANTVLWLAAGLAGGVAVYAASVLPSGAPGGMPARGLGSMLAGIARDVAHTTRDPAFLRTLLLVGAPAKAVLTGVIAFALPLLLARKGYPPNDIGQIVMLYALGVLAAGGRAARLVDRLGRTDWPLFLGAALSGLGLFVIGAVDWPPLAVRIAGIEPFVIAGAVFLVGVAHGFINAPVVTNVADLPLAQRMGPGAAAANYRFLERIGHIAGPLIVGQMLILGLTMPPLVALGAALILFGVVFYLLRSAPRPQPSAGD